MSISATTVLPLLGFLRTELPIRPDEMARITIRVHSREAAARENRAFLDHLMSRLSMMAGLRTLIRQVNSLYYFNTCSGNPGRLETKFGIFVATTSASLDEANVLDEKTEYDRTHRVVLV